MINLVIDSCSLLQLVSVEGYNTFLADLENYINNDKVNFLTHEVIIEEWNKHKNRLQKTKERKLLYGSKKGGVENMDIELLPSNSRIISHLETQTKQIDTILSNAHIISTPEGIQNEFADRFSKRLAPFHKKTDSLNDWYIIGSICHHCTIYDIKDLFFISRNHNDFANDDRNKIHPTIQSRFPKLNIIYYENYSHFFDNLRTEDIFFHSNTQLNLATNEKFTYKSSVKKTVLESIYNIYSNLYSEINFIPIHILEKYHPFSESNDITGNFSHFTLDSNNSTLFSFFNDIEIKDEKTIIINENSEIVDIDNYEIKIEFILRRLTHNLVYNVSNIRLRQNVNIYYNYQENDCKCAKCNFNNLLLYDAMKQINDKTDNIKEKLMLAYINYKLGNLKVACNLYIEISKEAFDRKNYITYYICRYNLKQLGTFLNSFFYNREIDQELVVKLKLIDPIEEAVKLKSVTDYNLLLFIAQEDYFTSAFQNIKVSVDKILEHYYSQLKGGWSSNSYVWTLIEEFTRLETFINSNYIIYDKYSNFQKLFDLVVEGLFASHSIKEENGSNFPSFDNYWIQKFIMYGKGNSLLKYFIKFNLKKLIHNPDEDGNYFFVKISDNFFYNEEVNKNFLANTEDTGNRYFKHSYESMLENIIVLFALIDLPIDVINNFAGTLLKFLQNRINNYSLLDQVKLVFQRKGKMFSHNILMNYLYYVAVDIETRNIDLLKSIISSFNEVGFSKINYQVYNDLLRKLTILLKNHDDYNICEILISIYRRSDQQGKNEITNIISNSLTEKFSFKVFYLASIYDIINVNKKTLNTLLDELKVDEDTHSFKSIFKGQLNFQNEDLNCILNLIFKFNIQLSNDRIRKIKSIHPYYEWLISMDTFDYEKFHPRWALEFQTIYFVSKMAKSRKLISELLNYSEINSDTRMDKLIIEIVRLSKK